MSPTKETLLAWQNRPQRLVAKFIKQNLSNESASLNGNNNVTRNVGRLRHSSLNNEKVEGASTNNGKSIPAPSFYRQSQNSSRTTSESSLAEIESYEDELNPSKKFTGKGDGNRVRIDSMSQITGVRFDANPEH